MKISFLEAAECELQCAMDYYNQQKQGLGYEFLAAIKAAVGRIADFPEAWQPLSKRTRRCLTRVSIWRYLSNPQRRDIDCRR